MLKTSRKVRFYMNFTANPLPFLKGYLVPEGPAAQSFGGSNLEGSLLQARSHDVNSWSPFDSVQICLKRVLLESFVFATFLMIPNQTISGIKYAQRVV